jgi:hypothetical protein
MYVRKLLSDLVTKLVTTELITHTHTHNIYKYITYVYVYIQYPLNKS